MKRALLLLCLAGCPDPESPPQIELYSLTAAPPSSRAKIISDDNYEVYSVELSAGVAIAAACWSSCTSSCLPTIDVADKGVLEVRDVYRVNGGQGDVALIGKSVGTTTMRVTSGCAGRTYTVSVVPR